MLSYTLLTGATGLLGRYLLRDLLLDDYRIAVVVRPSKNQSPEERIEAILQMWERELGATLPRPVCLAGDVTQEFLGLDRLGLRWVAQHCDRVLHNAAVLQFYSDGDAGEPWRTNVGGTRHVVHLCERLGIGDVHYVSTAYVCGKRSGLVKEKEFDVGQEFRNDYEHSKFLAEKLIRESEKLAQVTIYRPTVIAGDSRTGYTSTYHGLYMYLKLMSVLVRNTEPGADGVRHTPVRLRMSGDERRNIVPVDWVSQTICRLFATPAGHGGTFHLAPAEPLTPREVIECGYRYFNSRGVEFVGEQASSNGRRSDIERAAQAHMTIYEPYELDDPEFDMTQLQRFVGDVPSPKIDNAMLVRFWRYGERDRWGRRPAPPVDVPLRVGDYLRSVLPTRLETALDVSGRRVPVAGVDVTGPGGGQWQLVVKESSVLDFDVGLPTRDVPVLRFGHDTFATLAQGGAPRASLGSCEMPAALGNGSLLGRVGRAIFPAISVPLV